MPQQAKQPAKVILIRGLPGSGKSYLAQALQANLGKDKVVMLDPDAIDFETNTYKQMVADLTKQGVDPKFFPYRHLRSQAHRGITEGKIVIWNQPFTDPDGFNKTIINLQDYAKQNNAPMEILVVEVELDRSAAKARVNSRKQAGGHGPSDGYFNRLASDYRSMAGSDLKVISVPGDQDIAKSVGSVKAAL